LFDISRETATDGRDGKQCHADHKYQSPSVSIAEGAAHQKKRGKK
jgi:hypothetical protein